MTSINIKAERLIWNDALECVTSINDSPIRNFTGDARHRYRVRHSIEELGDYVRFLGDNCKEIDKKKYIEVFEPLLPCLNRIVARASGLY
jgi:hypothetical protein